MKSSQTLTQLEAKKQDLENQIAEERSSEALKKLAVQRSQLEKQIAYQQTVLDALVSKTERLREESEAETARLIKQAQKEVDEALKVEVGELTSLKDQQKALKTEITKLEKLKQTAESEYATQSHAQGIKLKERSLELLKQTELLGETATLQEKTQEEVRLLEAQRSQVKESVGLAELELNLTKERTIQLIEDADRLTKDFEEKKLNYEVEEAKLSKQVDILTFQSESLAKDIIEKQQQHDQVAENLANWAKKLDEQDRNLRVREEKLQQRDKVLIRNANLLKM